MAEDETFTEWLESSLITLLLHTETLLEVEILDIDCVIGGMLVLSMLFLFLLNRREGEDGWKRLLSMPAARIEPAEEGLFIGTRISMLALGLPFIKLLFFLEDNSIG